MSGAYGSRCAAAGLTVAAECVDHKVPVTAGGDMWELANHQALCLACNTAKGNRLLETRR